MKKLIGLFVIAGMVTFFACGPKGPSDADKKKADSLKADSAAQVEKKAKVADSIAAAKVKATADSTRKADSIAKANKGGYKGGNTGGNKPKDNTPVVKPTKPSGKG